MTKKQVAESISKKTGLQLGDCEQMVGAFTETVKESLTSGKSIYMRGFGTFRPVHRAEKLARNISAGTPVIVPAKTIPGFKPSKSFQI